MTPTTILPSTSTSSSPGSRSSLSTTGTGTNDAGTNDAGTNDAGTTDSSTNDAGTTDAGTRGTGGGAVAPARSSASFAADPTSQHSIVRLQREWGNLSRSPRALALVEGWALHVVPCRSLDDVLIATGLGLRGCPGDHDDELVGRLIVLARDHALAGRIVLQRLLPGLAAIARRRSRGSHSAVLLETTDELLVTAWAVIRTYRVERYPSFVVPSMLREIERRTFRPDRRRRLEVVAVGDDVLARAPAPEQAPSAAEQVAELLADAARSGLDPTDLELARRLAAGATSAELAAEREVTDRTIRNHRAALVHRLRAVARSHVA